jgi:hypothetical protein
MSRPLDPATVEAIAHEVADMLRRRGEAGERVLLTAGQVAARFGVDRSWVYAHAHQLGVVRLGFGRRPRLRFDPAIVAQYLLAPPPRDETIATQPTTADVQLLPIRARPVRPRRSLGGETAPPHS